MKIKKQFNYRTSDKVHFFNKTEQTFQVPIKKIIHFIWLCRNISFFSSGYEVINRLCRLPRQMPSEWVVEGNLWKSVACLCPCVASTCIRIFTQLKRRMRGMILKTQKDINLSGYQPTTNDLSRRWDVKTNKQTPKTCCKSKLQYNWHKPKIFLKNTVLPVLYVLLDAGNKYAENKQSVVSQALPHPES